MPARGTYYIGLNLGQMADDTALTVLQDVKGSERRYHLRHIERMKLGTPWRLLHE